MSEPKKYNLKKSEVVLINFVYQKQAEIVSMLLSQIASERLSYPLTQNSQFDMNLEKGEITISEREVEKPKEGIVKTAK